jgi:hypothetical protein
LYARSYVASVTTICALTWKLCPPRILTTGKRNKQQLSSSARLEIRQRVFFREVREVKDA